MGQKLPTEGVSNVELNTSDSIKKIINDSGYSVDEFVELLHTDRVLNDNEKTVVDNIRNEIGVPDVGIKMKKQSHKVIYISIYMMKNIQA
ncbi:hypothetical protein [Bacillus mycoides]|uniref:Uncharacterized protein n=1 Tax=Bacillus mycoides TaxID=1405 RepID=A0A7T3S1D1_BACMY|nr:hypothetical protein [Bacillus mycoides]MED1431011.1 hypothetical protein [Bacillus mycoides]MED1487354.1 hypothetical protein [Bacillus mycoides]QQA13602.1 hypothetical protein I6G81_01645 [Bacillus mycoides]